MINISSIHIFSFVFIKSSLFFDGGLCNGSFIRAYFQDVHFTREVISAVSQELRQSRPAELSPVVNISDDVTL